MHDRDTKLTIYIYMVLYLFINKKYIIMIMKLNMLLDRKKRKEKLIYTK